MFYWIYGYPATATALFVAVLVAATCIAILVSHRFFSMDSAQGARQRHGGFRALQFFRALRASGGASRTRHLSEVFHRARDQQQRSF
jgi:hypothetical protein